jgi:acyl-CoA thioesterase YciA
MKKSGAAIAVGSFGKLVLSFVGEAAVGLTLQHNLILPADTNHHGTLYAGSLLRLALEAGYATAWRHCGSQSNLLLRRVLNLECLRPVPVGTVIEIRGAVLHRARAYLVTGLLGAPLEAGQGPWLEALLGFAQVDETGRPDALPEAEASAIPDSEDWRRLVGRLNKLLKVR